MKFCTEVDLVKVLKASLTSMYKKGDNIEIFEEVSLGFGIADVVVSNLINSYSVFRSNENFVLCYFDINIYDIISKFENGISVAKIIDITRGNKKKTFDALDKLISLKYIYNEDSIFYVSNKYTFPFKNNIAIEAKLKDWKRALKQAYRYKWFAEYSFVVIDEHYSKKAIENIDVFKKYNVGLASISVDGNLIRYYSPVSEIPYDMKMKILFSEKILHYQMLAR